MDTGGFGMKSVWCSYDGRIMYVRSSSMLNALNMYNNTRIKNHFGKFIIFKGYWSALQREFAGKGKLHMVATIVSSVFESNVVQILFEFNCIDAVLNHDRFRSCGREMSEWWQRPCAASRGKSVRSPHDLYYETELSGVWKGGSLKKTLRVNGSKIQYESLFCGLTPVAKIRREFAALKSSTAAQYKTYVWCHANGPNEISYRVARLVRIIYCLLLGYLSC